MVCYSNQNRLAPVLNIFLLTFETGIVVELQDDRYGKDLGEQLVPWNILLRTQCSNKNLLQTVYKTDKGSASLYLGLGTRVHPWRIHVDIWQNRYSIVK